MRLPLVVLLASAVALAQPSLPFLPARKPPPPAIQKLFDKQQSGAELTDAEQKALDAWEEQAAREMQDALLDSVRTMPGAEAALAEATGDLCPAPRGPASVTSPSRAEYQKLVEAVARDYGRKLGAVAAQLDRGLAQAKADNVGANAALPLSIAGGATAAVYTTSWSCKRRPDDALFASNLGSLLDGVADERAGPVLAYAAARAPGTVLPNVNLGWLHFHRGDWARAKAAFDTAAKRAPKAGAVLLGQGMVAHCRGDHPRAVELLAQALSQLSSAAAEQALEQSSSQADPDADAEGDAESDRRARASRARPVPRREGLARNSPAPELVIHEPVLLGSNDQQVLVGGGRNQAIITDYTAKTQALLKEQQGLSPNANRPPAPVRTATSLTLHRGDEALAALARAQYTAYAAKIRAVRAPFEREFDRQRELVNGRVDQIERAARAHGPQYLAAFCGNLRPFLNGEFGKFSSRWPAIWAAEKKLIREYAEDAGATIAHIRHDDLRRYLDIERQLHLLSWMQDGPADLIGWSATGAGITGCGEPAPPAASTQTKRPGDVKKAPCPPAIANGFGLDCGFVSASLDCEKISIQAGEGLIGRIEHNYVKHEQTYFIGVGASVGAGVGQLNAGVEGTVGAYVTASGGEFRDFGYQASAGAAAGVFSLEAGVTVGAISGPSTSSSASLNLGPASTGFPGK